MLRCARRDLLDELKERVRLAVALPVRIDIRDAFDGTSTELLVTSNLDSGARGRPRVTFVSPTPNPQLVRVTPVHPLFVAHFQCG